MNFILDSTKICLNKEEKLQHSDQINRSISLANPMVILINELVTGPCKVNQDIVMSDFFLKKMNGVIVRILDNMESEFYNFKHACLLLVLSLTEGMNRHHLYEISVRIPVGTFIEFILRMTKKLYVHQVILDGDY